MGAGSHQELPRDFHPGSRPSFPSLGEIDQNVSLTVLPGRQLPLPPSTVTPVKTRKKALRSSFRRPFRAWGRELGQSRCQCVSRRWRKPRSAQQGSLSLPRLRAARRSTLVGRRVAAPALLLRPAQERALGLGAEAKGPSQRLGPRCSLARNI